MAQASNYQEQTSNNRVINANESKVKRGDRVRHRLTRKYYERSIQCGRVIR